MTKQLSEKRINELLKAERKLNALEAGGVDNWEWYGESLREFFAENEIEDLVRTFVERDLKENYLVEDVEVDYPAGMDAGHSVTLTADGEESMIKHLLKIVNEAIEISKGEF